MAKRVLIVDDSATARMLIQRCFEIAGWQDAAYVEASNGREALSELGHEPFDLIATDLNMPKMDGLELLRAIRGHSTLSDQKVVVISSAGNSAKLEQLRQLGVNDILSKPISPAAVVEMIENLFGSDDGS